MKTADIERKLANAISNEVPDVIDSILSVCEEHDKKKLTVIENTNKAKGSGKLKTLRVAAAVIALLFCGYAGMSQYQAAYAVESVVLLDVNPSSELKVNRREKVIAAAGLNKDGEAVLAKMDRNGKNPKGEKIDRAVGDIVNVMVGAGYLGEKNTTVLLTVNNPDEKKSAEMKSRLMADINSTLNANRIEGAVIVQSSTADDKTAEFAIKYGISEGKAELIEKIIAGDPQLTFEELAKLSISELGLLTEKQANGGQTSGVAISGKISANGYVTSEAAVNSALSQANMASDGKAEIGVSVGVSEGKLVYDVSLKSESTEYTFKVDAKTGLVLNWAANPAGSGISIGGQASASGSASGNAGQFGTGGQISGNASAGQNNIGGQISGQINGNVSVTPAVPSPVPSGSGAGSSGISAEQIINNVIDIFTKAKEKVTGS
ncbi:MAG: hypothetical protein GX488_07395 [Clostridiales bacterium]|nr:hypothetical protein [Clostridiales bacterium]